MPSSFPIRKVVALWLVLGTADAAWAQDCPTAPKPPETIGLVPDMVPRALFDRLVGWIALNTSYDVSKTYRDPPRLSFCDVEDVIDYESGTITVEPMLEAAFDRSRRLIHLVRPWSAEDPYDQSVLLHELIHDVQQSNRDWPCIGAPEFEAYRLQDKFLHEQSVPHFFDWVLIRLISTCPAATGQD